jgi:hypothetical protein
MAEAPIDTVTMDNVIRVCSPGEAEIAQDRIRFAQRLAATGRIAG